MALRLPSQLINETVTAGILGVKVTTLRRWRWSGDGPGFVKIGTAVRYDPIELQKFIESCRRTSTTDAGPEAQ